ILPLPFVLASFISSTLTRLAVNLLGKRGESLPQQLPNGAEGASNQAGASWSPNPGESRSERKEQPCSASSRRSASASQRSEEPPSAELRSPGRRPPTPAPPRRPDSRHLRCATCPRTAPPRTRTRRRRSPATRRRRRRQPRSRRSAKAPP